MSALDTEFEIEVQRAPVNIRQARTVIAVAHRLSTLSSFDRVVVIDQGKVVEDGSLADLRRPGTMFERMWRLQAEGLAAKRSEQTERQAEEALR
ncbi:hypothetical protein [Rhizobium sp. HT1-10]|uniref:hypothetical protein n=1 Tax=Rhizobium sp. HT1-10 TaxID=3111638 RepID=UPI003C1E917C